MEERDLEFKEDLRKAIEKIVIGYFYEHGIWENSPKARKAVKEGLARNRYANDYCALSVIDRYFDDVMGSVTGQYFGKNHIAPHSYPFGDCVYLTQTERIMVNELKRINKGKSTEEMVELARRVESATNKIDTAKLPQSICDNFVDATEQDKPLIDELYSDAIFWILELYLGLNKRPVSEVKRRLLFDAQRSLSKNNHPSPEAFIEKYLDKIYDTAYGEISKQYIIIPPQEE